MASQQTQPALFERLFRTMLRKGVDPNKQNQQGETPLHMAAFRGKTNSVSLLLKFQANPNLKNKSVFFYPHFFFIFIFLNLKVWRNCSSSCN